MGGITRTNEGDKSVEYNGGIKTDHVTRVMTSPLITVVSSLIPMRLIIEIM